MVKKNICSNGKMILEETKAVVVDEEEIYAASGGHISVNSESDSDFEEVDEIKYQPLPKRRRIARSAHQLPVG